MRPFATMLVSALVLFATTVRAQTPAALTDAEQLARDSAKLAADTKANLNATAFQAEAAAVSTDTQKLATDGGLPKTITVKNYVLNLNLGGAGAVDLAFPTKGISAGGGAGLLFDVGVGRQSDGSDHWHVSLAAMVQSLTSTVDGVAKTVPAVTIALMPGYQPTLNAPIYGFGPAVSCPTNGGWCLIGVALTTSIAATLKQLNVPIATGG